LQLHRVETISALEQHVSSAILASYWIFWLEYCNSVAFTANILGSFYFQIHGLRFQKENKAATKLTIKNRSEKMKKNYKILLFKGFSGTENL